MSRIIDDVGYICLLEACELSNLRWFLRSTKREHLPASYSSKHRIFLEKMLLKWFLLAVALFGSSSAQNVTGNYTGPLRPQVHFSPPVGFMNDPNGMFRDADGLWHLYYQCSYLLRSSSTTTN